jgi:hypothetical protein
MNMLEPDRWDEVLSRVTGMVYRGTERISSNALLNRLEVGPDPIVRQKVGKQLVSHMRRLGWTGPRAMRIPAENGHAAGSSGYWRLPSRPPQPAVNVEGEVEAEVDSLADDLPAALEQVTRLGLKKLEKVLRVPLDPTDGNLVRSQVTAAIGAINAQLRADEHQLRRKTQGDVLQRLIKIIEEEKKKLPKTSVAIPLTAEQQRTEHVDLERSDAEASVMASGGDGSEKGYGSEKG